MDKYGRRTNNDFAKLYSQPDIVATKKSKGIGQACHV